MPVVGFAALLALSAHVGIRPVLSRSQAASPDTGAKHSGALEFQGKPVDPAEVLFTLERAAYLDDPHYCSVTVHGDGSVEWHGHESVAQKGVRKAQVETGAVRLLLRRADEIGLFDLADRYIDGASDISEAYITVCIGKRSKRIETRILDERSYTESRGEDWNVRSALLQMADLIDVAAETWRWKYVAADTQSERVGSSVRAFELPPGFSVSLQRFSEDGSQTYEVSINGSGGGTWHGMNQVREAGLRRFDVPYDDLMLLAERLLRADCLDQPARKGKGKYPRQITLHVHTDDRDFVRERKTFRDPEAGSEQATEAEYFALCELIDVIARTDRFLGARDERTASEIPVPHSK